MGNWLIRISNLIDHASEGMSCHNQLLFSDMVVFTSWYSEPHRWTFSGISNSWVVTCLLTFSEVAMEIVKVIYIVILVIFFLRVELNSKVSQHSFERSSKMTIRRRSLEASMLLSSSQTCRVHRQFMYYQLLRYKYRKYKYSFYQKW